MARILFVITEDWALVSHRLHLVKYAIEHGYEVAVATRINSYRDKFERLGITVFDWPLKRRSLNPFSEIRIVARLISIVRQFKPDLIHAVALKPVIYTGIATRFFFEGAVVSALGGVGYIYSSDRLHARILRYPAQMMLKLALFGRRRRLILQNIDDFEMFARAGVIPRSHICLVKGAGVEVEIFKMTDMPLDSTWIILPARMLWDKGVGEFVNVARRVRLKRPKVKFILVGDVDVQNPVSISKDQINRWVEEGYVEHWDRVGHDQMYWIYKSASIVCLPSYREGLPKVLLEAASVGRPLVAFDVPGCREIVRSGSTGELVPFAREDLLEQSLMSLIDDKEKCERLGINGHHLVRSEFASEVINERTSQIWQGLLGD